MTAIDTYNKLMHTKEDLVPELKMYYSESDKFAMVRHPLVYSVPHTDSMNALVNYRLELKKAHLAKAIVAKNYESIPFIYERAYRLNGFIEHCIGYVNNRQYWEIISSIYIDSENIRQNVDIWEMLLFTPRTNSKFFMSPEDRKTLKLMDDEILVYRGYVDTWKGFSWTTDEEKAFWFATRFNRTGEVVSGIVKKKDVIGYLSGRGESEIVCHWKNVKIRK